MKLGKDWLHSLRTYGTDPLFLGAAGLKLVSGALFDSHYLRDLFIPFIRFFVDSGYANPWQEFFNRGILDAFPHSTTMLLSLALPQQLGAWVFQGSAHIPWAVQLLLTRTPIFLADVLLYLILCRWLETRWRQVLLLYWCSPILFYINYGLGQLDLVPTALLALSIWYAVRHSPVKSGLVFALGLAAKHHLLAAVPLLVYYLWKKGAESRQGELVWKFIAASAVGVVVLIGPLLSSEGYRALVLGAKESGWVYALGIQLPQEMTILLCPLVIFGLILHFFSYQRLTKDALILYTGLLYTILILLVPPKAGWASWGFPFLCFFLIRHDMVGYLPFWAYNLAYLLYYVVPKSWLLAVPQGENLLLTGMDASLGLVALWMYRVGVKSYVRYKTGYKTRAIGIGGDSASGKHTLAETLTSVLGPVNTVRLHGDDYHRWPREHPAWKDQTHLDPRSNYFRQPVDHILELKGGSTIQKVAYDHSKGTFTEPSAVASNRYIVFEGLHPFVFQRMRDIFDIRIFIATDEGLRRQWKIQRDTQERGHSKEQVVAEMERRAADSEQFIQPQAQFADWVVEYLPSEGESVKARHHISSQVVEIEDLTEELKRVSTLSCLWSMEPNLRRQVLEVSGTITAAEIEAIARTLFPELGDLAGVLPEWQADLKGVNQLIFTCLLFGLEKA